jgi:uncharacterized protein (TIGR02271 family)
VTRSHLDLGDNLKPISELHNFSVEPGDPDPRGWNVVGTEGRRYGVVRDLVVDTSAMKVRHLVVDMDGDGAVNPTGSDSVLLDVNDVELRGDSRQVLARSIATGRAYQSAASAMDRDTTRSSGRDTSSEHRTLTRAEEELEIGKREVSRGEARVGKHVETEHVSTPVTRRREEVVVERRPVHEGARADASMSEDEVRIPLMEEEVVVEKRPVVKEELVVGKRTVEERDTVETEVRREEFDIDTNPTSRNRNRGER